MIRNSVILNTFTLACIFFICHLVQAQNPLLNPLSLRDWAERLDVQSRLLPQEVVFVHMDNNCYFLGDTIYYKVYVTRSDTERLTDMSRVVYTELLDNDGYLIERQILRMEEGQAFGSFCLSDTLYCGHYELRAYTRWQLNWGMYEHEHSERTKYWFFNEKMRDEFFRDYDKLYSRVFPVYMKPRKEGEYAQDMALRPLRRYYKTRDKEQKVLVSLYPEGGDWVEGIAQRIAFEARSEEGEHMDGTLVVQDEKGNLVAQGTTLHRGRGMVTLTGSHDRPFKARFRWGEGRETEVELPQVKGDGVVLDARQDENDLLLHITARGEPKNDSLAFTILHNGRLKYYRTVDSHDIQVELDSLPNGIAQITLYDRQGRIWADRLFFVLHKGFSSQTVSIEHIKDSYEPYSPVQLKLKGVASGVVSVSVRDKALSPYTNDDGTILTEMLLSSQIKGFVEHPSYYFEKYDETHLRNLDLLMMVQGWRRHGWHELTHPMTISHPVEKSRTLYGEVYRMDIPPKKGFDPHRIDNPNWKSTKEEIAESWIPTPDSPGRKGFTLSHGGSGPVTLKGAMQYFAFDPYGDMEDDNAQGKAMMYDQHYLKAKQELKREVLVHAEFTQPGVEGVIGDAVTHEGRFTIPLPDFYGHCMMHVAASDSTRWDKQTQKGKRPFQWVYADDERNTSAVPEFYVRLQFPYPRFAKPYDFYHTQDTIYLSDEEDAERLDSKVIRLREVTVKTKRNGLRAFNQTKPAFKLDAYEAFNAVVDAGLHPPVYYKDVTLDLAVAANYIGEMGIKSRAYTLKPRWNYRNDSHFMDAVTRFRFRQLCYLDSIYVFTDYSPRKERDRRYAQDNQPEVSVDLHLMPDDGRRSAFRDRFYMLPGYNVCEEFYQPCYESLSPQDAPKDYRRTLYWNPSTQLDENGIATVTFWNNCRKNQLSVSVEGLALEGQLLTGRK